jgi:hypothetical protein
MDMPKTKSTGAGKSENLEFKDWQERARNERRSRSDKRLEDSSEYLTTGGKERRKLKERRQSGERRDKWIRIGKWKSVPVFDE